MSGAGELEIKDFCAVECRLELEDGGSYSR